ncbi:hypothetical protein VIS19158_13702, partial [Vibrio scophthalmi LMG 19158]
GIKPQQKCWGFFTSGFWSLSLLGRAADPANYKTARVEDSNLSTPAIY